MCYWAEDVAGGVSPNAESIHDHDGRGEKSQDERIVEGCEWRHTSLLTDLCLAMRSDPLGMIKGLGEVVTCIYRPAVTYAFPDPHIGISAFTGTCELNKRSRWDCAEVVQARRAESADERHGSLRESEGPRADGVQLPGTIAVQNGEQT